MVNALNLTSSSEVHYMLPHRRLPDRAQHRSPWPRGGQPVVWVDELLYGNQHCIRQETLRLRSTHLLLRSSDMRPCTKHSTKVTPPQIKHSWRQLIRKDVPEWRATDQHKDLQPWKEQTSEPSKGEIPEEGKTDGRLSDTRGSLREQRRLNGATEGLLWHYWWKWLSQRIAPGCVCGCVAADRLELTPLHQW